MLQSLTSLFNAPVAEPPPARDVARTVISDLHSGSNFALFLNREWHGRKNSHIPRAAQIKIRQRFESYAEEFRLFRQGKKVQMIVNGDAIDGDHHHSNDVCTADPYEQADIHVELMQDFQKRIDWQAGDELYYTRGTQTHVNEAENNIGREMNAVMCGDYYVWDLLKLSSNGTLSWFVHHGPSAGKGANEGNALRNWLKNIYYDGLKDNFDLPDIVHSGHTHAPDYQPFGYRMNGHEYKNMYGIILPSWQMKTTYAWMKAPVQKNKIGGVHYEIKADGTITIPKFSILETD